MSFSFQAGLHFVFIKVGIMDETRPKPIGYKLEAIYPTPRGGIATQAFIMCVSCNGAVSSSGGPSYNVICVKCAEHLMTLGSLK